MRYEYDKIGRPINLNLSNPVYRNEQRKISYHRVEILSLVPTDPYYLAGLRYIS